MKHNPCKYLPSDPWFICDRCGFKTRYSKGKKTWDGLFVCDADWEAKHAQLYPPPIKYDEGKPYKNARPEPEDEFIDTSVPVNPDDL